MPENNEPIDRLLGRVIGKLENIEERLRRADDSRSLMHQEINTLILRTTQLESETLSVKSQVAKLQTVTDDVITLRNQAQGAGVLGSWLLKIGIGVITVAGWIVAFWGQIVTWINTRP